MSLGTDDMQAAGGDDFVLLRFTLGLDLRLQAGLPLRRHLRVRVQRFLEEKLRVSAQQNVGAAPGHIGRDRDARFAPRLGDDLRLPLVVLRVQHAVLDALAHQIACKALRLLDGDRPDECGLASLMAILNVLHDGVELLFFGAIHDVGEILSDVGAVRGRHHDFKVVDFRELAGLGIGRPGHARELVVHPEEVLEGDRRQCLIFIGNLDLFLRFDGLMQTVRPAAARHQPAGELVHDDDLSVLDHIIHVPVVEDVRA